MGTRSVIAIEKENGRIHSIYCHWDGYPEHVGMMLQMFYPTVYKVEALIAHGGISSLKPKLAAPKGEKHSFEFNYGYYNNESPCISPLDEATIFYRRDRGDDLDIEKWPHMQFFESYMSETYGWCEWAYLFKDGKWHVKSLTEFIWSDKLKQGFITSEWRTFEPQAIEYFQSVIDEWELEKKKVLELQEG